jgi:hypothetical protein
MRQQTIFRTPALFVQQCEQRGGTDHLPWIWALLYFVRIGAKGKKWESATRCFGSGRHSATLRRDAYLSRLSLISQLRPDQTFHSDGSGHLA